jgi:hypothetical protein
MRFYSLAFVFAVLSIVFFSISIQAQIIIISSLQQRVEGEGKVTIRQDPRIEVLLGTVYTGDEEKIIQVSGYRIQIYAGNNSREARDETERLASRVRELFPSVKAYSSFNPPHWICRIGDFPSIEEAHDMMHKLKTEANIKEALVVKEQINIYL